MKNDATVEETEEEQMGGKMKREKKNGKGLQPLDCNSNVGGFFFFGGGMYKRNPVKPSKTHFKPAAPEKCTSRFIKCANKVK